MLCNQLKIAPTETDETDILCLTVASPGFVVMYFYILQCTDNPLNNEANIPPWVSVAWMLNVRLSIFQ